jgi:parvulin-like peptidyl-prolyl isomerase
MTLRAKPVARRRGRTGWDAGDRRNNLINAGFFAAIILSVLILVGYAAWSWYDDHFGAAATVNGQVITKDALRNRLEIEDFNLGYIERRIQTLLALGRVSAADAQNQLDIISQRRQQLAQLTLERLVDVSLQAKLAADNGIAVSEQDIDAQLVDLATTSEERHVWMIEVEPNSDAVTGEVTDEQKRIALGNAQRALAQLKSGVAWEDVARTVSTAGNAAQAGDLGWLAKTSGYDQAFMDAVFAVDVNATTDIVEGEDGTYRIGRFTESAPAEVDQTFQQGITDAGILLADYREAAKGDVVRKKLSDKIVADLSAPGLQRHVLEIYLPEPNTGGSASEGGVKVRHIVFAPKDDTTNAADLPADDPAWAKAKAEADAAYAELKLHPEKFDEMARTLSDERTAKITGGKQPWYYPGSSVDADFLKAILADGLTPGQLLAPVKSSFGWHVIQFMRPTGDGDRAWLESLKAKATSEALFRQLAIDNSEGTGAKDGGDVGWIAKDQLADALDKAIFATPIGAMSDVTEVTDDGTYLVRILAEEQRDPSEEQLKIFKDSGFSNWYTKQKETADIVYNIGSSTGTA